MTQLAGKIEDLGLGEILQIISFSRKSGVLRLESGRKKGAIVFSDGNVIKATATELTQGVGEALAGQGLLTAPQLEKARQIQKEGAYASTLGDVIIREFRVPEEAVTKAARELIEKTIYYLFRWLEGRFIFELSEYEQGPDDIKSDRLQYVLRDGLNPQFLAMEGTRLLDEVKRGAVAAPTIDTAGAGQTASQATKGTEPAGEDEVGFQDVFNEIEQAGGFLEEGAGAEESAPEERGFRILKYMLTELGGVQSVNEVVLLILRFSSEIVNRAVVFGVKREGIVGIGQSGVEVEDDIPDRKIRKMNVPAGEPSILREAIDKKGMVVRERIEPNHWNGYIMKELGGHEPTAGAIAAPILVHNRVALILYGDNVPENQRLRDLSILEIFMAQASMALERILLKKQLRRR